ncbi:MAG: hypothetical protein IPG22_17325 [Acidobacteria bacterium]|nr:hypothetical protein [Acidobacteriota bacterium]
MTDAADQSAKGALSGRTRKAESGAIFDSLAAYGSEGEAKDFTLAYGRRSKMELQPKHHLWQ